MTQPAAVIACAFPLLITVVVLTALPMRLPQEPEGKPRTPRDTRPLDLPTHFKHVLIYIPLVAACAYVLQFLQVRLFLFAERDGAPFVYHQTSIPAVPWLSAMFVGIVIAGPIGYRLMLWHYGPKYVLAIADRPDRSQMPMSLRQTIAIIWPMAIACAIFMVALNTALFDTYLRVTDGRIEYSFFTSPRSHHQSIAAIRELRVYSRSYEDKGHVVDRRRLEIRLADGSLINTFNLIDEHELERLIAAIMREPAFRGIVTKSDEALE